MAVPRPREAEREKETPDRREKDWQGEKTGATNRFMADLDTANCPAGPSRGFSTNTHTHKPKHTNPNPNTHKPKHTHTDTHFDIPSVCNSKVCAVCV